MKTSWHIWKSLRIPPAYHPLADRLHFERHYARVGLFWAVIVAAVLVLIMLVPGMFMLYIVMFPLLYLFISVTLNASVWTANIAHLIARQRSSQVYDLLCLLPDGPARLNWLICAEVLHHKSILSRAHNDAQSIILVIGILPLVGLVALIMSTDEETRMTSLVWFLLSLALIIVLLVDYVQSVTLSCLVGIVAGNRLRATQEARVWSMVILATAQVSFYALLALTMTVVMYFYGNAEQIELVPALLVPLIITLTYIGLRELLNQVLLHMMTRTLNEDQSEFTHHSFLSR